MMARVVHAPVTDSPFAVGWQRYEAPPLDLDVLDAKPHQPVRLADPVAHAPQGGRLRPPLAFDLLGGWCVDADDVDAWVRQHGPAIEVDGRLPCTEVAFALGNTVTRGSEWLRGAFDWAHVHAVHGAQRLDPAELRPDHTLFRADWCGAVYGSSVFVIDHLTQMHQLHLLEDHFVALTVENVFHSRLNAVVTLRAFGPSDPKRTRLVRSWRRYVERRYLEDHQIWAHKATDRPPRYGPFDADVIEFDRYWRKLSAPTAA
jgi:hypothetical protein